MRHYSKRKQHTAIYLRQALLSFLLLCVTIHLCFSVSLIETLFPPATKIPQLTKDSYIDSHPDVKLTFDTLYYTGFDNYSDTKLTGHYYYALQDNRFILVLLNPTDKEPEDTLEHYNGKFRITYDETQYNKLTDQLAQSLNWSQESLRNISLPILVSEPDYHWLSSFMASVLLIVCLITFLLVTISNYRCYLKCRQYQKRLVRYKNNSRDSHYTKDI